jgi:hypothetical protein
VPFSAQLDSGSSALASTPNVDIWWKSHLRALHRATRPADRFFHVVTGFCRMNVDPTEHSVKPLADVRDAVRATLTVFANEYSLPLAAQTAS